MFQSCSAASRTQVKSSEQQVSLCETPGAPRSAFLRRRVTFWAGRRCRITGNDWLGRNADGWVTPQPIKTRTSGCLSCSFLPTSSWKRKKPVIVQTSFHPCVQIEMSRRAELLAASESGESEVKDVIKGREVFLNLRTACHARQPEICLKLNPLCLNSRSARIHFICYFDVRSRLNWTGSGARRGPYVTHICKAVLTSLD